MKTTKIYQLLIIFFALVSIMACETEDVTLEAETSINTPKIYRISATVDSGFRFLDSTIYTFNYSGDLLTSVQMNFQDYATLSYNSSGDTVTIYKKNNYLVQMIDTFKVMYSRVTGTNFYYINNIIINNALTSPFLYANFTRNTSKGNVLETSDIKYLPTSTFNIYNLLFTTPSSANVARYSCQKSNDIGPSGTFTCQLTYNIDRNNQANLPGQFITTNMYSDKTDFGLDGLDVMFLLQQSNIYPYRPHDNLVQYHNIPDGYNVFSSTVSYLPTNYEYLFDGSSRVSSVLTRNFDKRIRYNIFY